MDMRIRYIFITIIFLMQTRVMVAAQSSPFNDLYPILNEYVRDFPESFRKIPEERRYRLNEIVYFLEEQKQGEAPLQVLFISTADNTIGQMARVWSEAAAYYFGFKNYEAYSGGMDPSKITEKTITTLEKAGFIAYRIDVEGLKVYRLKYSYNLKPVNLFAKKIRHPSNPRHEFMAVFVDENAEINVQNVKGTYKRLFLSYEDPAGHDGTDMADETYQERCRQVAVEMFYVFSNLRKRLLKYQATGSE